MAPPISEILASYKMTPGRRDFTVLFPLFLEGDLDHHTTAAYNAIRKVRRAGVLVFVDGDLAKRQDDRDIPTIVVTLKYSKYHSDPEVWKHFCGAVMTMSEHINMNEVVGVIIDEPDLKPTPAR